MSRPADPLVSVVAPVFDEGDGVDGFVRRTGAVLQAAGLRYELILVDDGSTDDSWPRICAQSGADPRVRGIQLSRNFGKEAAVLAGLEHAGGDAVVVIDADLQHPPTAIPAMVQCWSDGAEVVEAVKRNRTGQPPVARLAASLFNATFTRLTTVDLVNATDFRLLSRPACDALLRLPEHSSFFRGTSSWIGFRRTVVEVDIDHRGDGASRWTFRSLCRLAVNGLTSFTSAPLHLVTVVGFGFAAFSVVLGVQTLVRWLRGGSVAGFPTVILVLLVMGTFILLGLGVIGEYLARIHEEVRGRPRYLVQGRTGPPAGEQPVIVGQRAEHAEL
ncbi:glycosyltransferase family 2 protein [Couchioplanes caeruleus]|uniref:Glycosyl transferase n=2 Tax=Couchioplanes caeruleus TaxID=56438 RepID=A0A1K0GHM8_9ACTN|nr:glycosyltransferase family 2 protein [Couchioplanes caeruleus]OJF10428.1 glycosyl transferase [Couchioplanes caeruleus subsp. caeruleus]ROP32495.1 glycosyltransferase involved in cell wall biosynthesis [Couchioplanes caeruleus]